MWRRGPSTGSSQASTPASTYTSAPDTCWMVRHVNQPFIHSILKNQDFFETKLLQYPRLRQASAAGCSMLNSAFLLSLLTPPDSWFQKKWGHNVSEFRQRFDSELTAGEGPKRLRNLYFLYLIELRALAKALPFFQQPSFRLYTGRPEEDQKHKELLLHILQLARSVRGPVLTPERAVRRFRSRSPVNIQSARVCCRKRCWIYDD